MPDASLGSLADVRGTSLRIGIERLSSYGAEYDALLDAVFADGASAGWICGVEVVRAVELTPVPVHIAVSRTSIHPQQSDALVAAFEGMAADGALDRLRQAAGVVGEPPPSPENETPP